MRGLDAAFLALDSATTPMNVGLVGVLDGGPLRDRRGNVRLAAIRHAVGEHLRGSPRVRQRIDAHAVADPRWVDDPAFDVARHVELRGIAHPGTRAQLYDVAAELVHEPLDPHHAQWRLWLIDGLDGDGGPVGVVLSAHHALTDGVSGLGLARLLLDGPSPHRPDRLRRMSRGDEPSTPLSTPLSNAVSQLLSTVVPHRLASVSRSSIATLARTSRDPLAPMTSLNHPIGPRRQLFVVHRRLDDVRAITGHYGVTVNDVMLCVVSGGLRELLLARGEPVDRPLRALVPVSLRGGHDGRGNGNSDGPRGYHVDDGRMGNSVASFIAPLPVAEPDDVQRLMIVHAATARSKREGEAQVSATLLAAAGWFPAPIVKLAAPIVHRQRLVNLVVTNVGRAEPMALLGARLREAHPIVPLARNLSIGVAVLSYDGPRGGELSVGVHVDPDACPDIDVFITGIERSLSRLRNLVQRAGGGARTTRSKEAHA